MLIGRYPSEAQAFRRVDKLKEHGMWPGIRVHDDGSADLLYDPDIEAEGFRHESKAAGGTDA